jgi:DNA mismatch repair ATPase MutS
MGPFFGCKQMVKYSGTSIEISAVKGFVKVPVAVGGIKIKPELLQNVGAILQILDWLQFTACQRIHALKRLKGVSQKEIANLILKQDEDAHKIAQIAIISCVTPNSLENFEKVLANWIAATAPKVKKNPVLSEEPETEMKKLENERQNVEREIDLLKAQLKQARCVKRNLEINIERKKDMIEIKKYQSRIYYRKSVSEPFATANRSINLIEAISVFPYLSKAIVEEKPFNVRKSLKLLTN